MNLRSILYQSTNSFLSPSHVYRFGFNGKEVDSEGMGGGSSTYDYGFRIYNAQLGKFLSVDPLTASYPWYTPYQFAGNMPINANDLDGLEPNVVISPLETSRPVLAPPNFNMPILRALGPVGFIIEFVRAHPPALPNPEHLRTEITYDGLGLGILLTKARVDVGKVAEVPYPSAQARHFCNDTLCILRA